MSYNCDFLDCTQKVTFLGRKCLKHRNICTQCSATENYYNIHISADVICHNCKLQNRLTKDIQNFICSVCLSTQIIRKGNKYACFEGDPQNYRRRKNHTPHGEVYE